MTWHQCEDANPCLLPGRCVLYHWALFSWAPKSLQKVNAVIKLKDTCSLKEGFPDSSVGKESACNAEDPSLIPGSGRSAGEGIGYALQYSWASFVAQLVKNPPAMQETWVRSLGWEDPLEKGKATNSSILAWKIPGVVKNQTWLSNFHFTYFKIYDYIYTHGSLSRPVSY